MLWKGCAFMTAVMAPTLVEERNRATLFQKLTVIFGAALIAMLCFMVVAFAASPSPAPAGGGSAITSIQTGVKSGMKEVYNVITAITIPIAAVAFAVQAFIMLFGGQKGMESAKKNMLIIVVVIAIVWLSPAIIEQVNSWFNTNSTGSVFS